MNIFGYSFGMLDSNEYIQLMLLNKILVVIPKNLGNLIDIKRITLVLISFLIFTINLYLFAIIFGQHFSFEYIHIFIREYTTWTNIFGYSFIKI